MFTMGTSINNCDIHVEYQNENICACTHHPTFTRDIWDIFGVNISLFFWLYVIFFVVFILLVLFYFICALNFHHTFINFF